MNRRTPVLRTRRPYVQGARARAAEATARRIVEAFYRRMLSQWPDEITLDTIAADASVTVQTVIRRFGDKQGLLAEAAKLLEADVDRRRQTPIGDVRRAVANLAADYEAIGDAVIRWLALEERHPAVRPCLELGRRSHRAWVELVLGPCLPDMPPGARTRAVDALVIATDVYTWKLLRRDMGRSAAATAEGMLLHVRAALAQFGARSAGTPAPRHGDSA